MDINEAREWLKGNRSMTNMVPIHPRETWTARIGQADAAAMQEAYWFVRGHAILANEPDYYDDGTPGEYGGIDPDDDPEDTPTKTVEALRFVDEFDEDHTLWTASTLAAAVRELSWALENGGGVRDEAGSDALNRAVAIAYAVESMQEDGDG